MWDLRIWASHPEVSAQRLHESSSIGETDLRQMQDRAAPRRRARHLSESEAQAEARIGWLTRC
jgi:hypothetical protein